MSGSDQRLTVPQVARLLGISERGVRDKIEHGQLRATKEGKRWLIDWPADDAVVRGSGSGSDAVVDDPSVDGTIVPADLERAIARTGQQYTADLRAMLGELRAVYEGQIEAQRETIAELRRRAEAAEAERDALRHQAAPAPPPEAASVPAQVEASAPPVAAGVPRNWWRRIFGG